MSSLTAVEQKLFEELFGMSGGYVLDLSNDRFAGLIQRAVHINIYSPTFKKYGDSKAKRLRAFWELESDQTVGKVLAEIYSLWEHDNSTDVPQADQELAEKCKGIIERLINSDIPSEKEIQSGEDDIEEFLAEDFGKPSLDKVPINADLKEILESRIVEAEDCFRSKAYLSSVIMSASVLEGILLGLANKNMQAFNSANSTPKDHKTLKPKPFGEWKLIDFINVSHELGKVSKDVKQYAHELRDFRNYVHPQKQLDSKFSPDVHTAKICLQVLKAAIADVSGER